MTTEPQERGIGPAVETALRRLRTVWGRHLDTPDILAEYRRVLTNLTLPSIVEKTVTDVIDTHTSGGYPPTPGYIAERGAAHQNRHNWRHQTSDQRGLTWLQAAPHPHDPPGTVRWIVVQPDGRRIPPGARAVDDMAAA